MYRLLLFLHLLAVVAYLGPSLGASFVSWRARGGDPALLRWALRQALPVYHLEHLMLLAVLLTGALLLWLGGGALLQLGWFRWKLALIGAVLLPVEVWDVWVTTRVLGPALRAGAGPVAPPALRAHARVLTAGGILFGAAALAVLWLSTAGRR